MTWSDRFGLHITSSLIFEIAIAITVMGGLGIIMEAIAYPSRAFQWRAAIRTETAEATGG